MKANTWASYPIILIMLCTKSWFIMTLCNTGLLHKHWHYYSFLIVIWVCSTDSDIKKTFDFYTVHLDFVLYSIFLDFPISSIISINVTDTKVVDQNFQVNWLKEKKKIDQNKSTDFLEIKTSNSSILCELLCSFFLF